MYRASNPVSLRSKAGTRGIPPSVSDWAPFVAWSRGRSQSSWWLVTSPHESGSVGCLLLVDSTGVQALSNYTWRDLLNYIPSAHSVDAPSRNLLADFDADSWDSSWWGRRLCIWCAQGHVMGSCVCEKAQSCRQLPGKCALLPRHLLLKHHEQGTAKIQRRIPALQIHGMHTEAEVWKCISWGLIEWVITQSKETWQVGMRKGPEGLFREKALLLPQFSSLPASCWSCSLAFKLWVANVCKI